MPEIETGPATKQPWEYQIGWARQNLLPSELGYFIKGLVGGLYLPSSSQTRPDRVRGDAKELNRRARKTQEAQNKFRFWTKAVTDVKNNAESNFINMVRYREQERLKSMQTENNKTFNTLYNKFLLLEKNKFKLKANIIKHSSTDNQYLKENNGQQVEIQDEDPFGNFTSALVGLGAVGLGLLPGPLRGMFTKIALNRKHANLAKQIGDINKKTRSSEMKHLRKIGAAEKISSQADDYGKYANMLLNNSKWIKLAGLGGFGAAHAGYGLYKDFEDRDRGYGNLTDSQIASNALSRLLTPYLAYNMGRGLGSVVGKGSPRYVARAWSKKHKKLGNNKAAEWWMTKHPNSAKSVSAEASRLLTDRIKSGSLPHPKYKGNEFGRIYDHNPNFGVEAVKQQIPVSKMWANNAGTGKIKQFWGTGKDLLSRRKLAINTGVGSGASALAAAGLATSKDELLSATNWMKDNLEKIELFGIGELIKAVPDWGVQGSLINAWTNTDQLTKPNTAADSRGYRIFRTRDRTGGINQSEREERRRSVIASTKPDGTVSYIPTDPNNNSTYLIVNPDRSFWNRLLPYSGEGERGRNVFIKTSKDSGKISSRSRSATDEEKEKFERQLKSERNDL